MRAWIDRTNDGLSGMPADGISVPPKKGDFGMSRWAGSKVRLHQPHDSAEGGMTASSLTYTHAVACPELVRADISPKGADSRFDPGCVKTLTRYDCTRNFEACGHVQSKKMQKFVLRSA